MRISVSGTIGIGKSTLINDFIKEWPNYKIPSTDYRDLLKNGQYPHSKACNKDGQWAILNHMIDEMQKYSKDDNVIFDRCPLDNLVFSLWSMSKGSTDIDTEFIDKCIPIVRESIRLLDIIFFIPVTKASPVPIVDNGRRETDPEYIAEIDNIFKSLQVQYHTNLDATPFFPKDDCAAIIEIFGKPQERIQLLKMYLNTDGGIIGDDASSILNPENIRELEQLVLEQATEHQKEQYFAKQKKLVDEFQTNLDAAPKKRGSNYTPKKKK
jgi:hypothetical protein